MQDQMDHLKRLASFHTKASTNIKKAEKEAEKARIKAEENEKKASEPKNFTLNIRNPSGENFVLRVPKTATIKTIRETLHSVHSRAFPSKKIVKDMSFFYNGVEMSDYRKRTAITQSGKD